ncbi:MAG: glycosyl hydrolase family 32, partial [Vicinamibacterales bacterium]
RDREKPNDLCVAFSRDGFHWSRDARDPFIPVSETPGDWNWANVQSAGGVCTVVGDRLHFYVSGRRGVPGTQLPGECSTGLATLRRDGFASVTDVWPAGRPRQIGLRPGLMTRPLRFTGRHLFVNADVKGELRVEVLDRAGRAIDGFSIDRSNAVRGDSTRAMVTWTGDSLARLAGQPVRFRFMLSNAKLYAFWVSRSARGESSGYLGGGGPAFASHQDR